MSWLVKGADFLVDDVLGGPNLDPDDLTTQEKMEIARRITNPESREEATDDPFLTDLVDIGITIVDSENHTIGDTASEIGDASGISWLETPAGRQALKEEVDEKWHELLEAFQEMMEHTILPAIKNITEGVSSAIIKLAEMVGFTIMSIVDREYRKQYGDPLDVGKTNVLQCQPVVSWDLTGDVSISKFSYIMIDVGQGLEFIAGAVYETVSHTDTMITVQRGVYNSYTLPDADDQPPEVSKFGILVPAHPLDPYALRCAEFSGFDFTPVRATLTINHVSSINLMPKFDETAYNTHDAVARRLMYIGEHMYLSTHSDQWFVGGSVPARRIQSQSQGSSHSQSGYQASPPSGIPDKWKAMIWEEANIIGMHIGNPVYKNVWVARKEYQSRLIDAQDSLEPGSFPLDSGQEYWHKYSETNIQLKVGVVHSLKY